MFSYVKILAEVSLVFGSFGTPLTSFSCSVVVVKQHWAWIVLGWETARDLKVLLATVRMLMLLRGEWAVSVQVLTLEM